MSKSKDTSGGYGTSKLFNEKQSNNKADEEDDVKKRREKQDKSKHNKMAVTENATGSGNSLNRNGRPPTTSVLRSAMYYQNRIIVPEVKARSPTGTVNSLPKKTATDGNDIKNASDDPIVKSRIGYSAAMNSNNPHVRSTASSNVPGASDKLHGNYAMNSEDGMDSPAIDIVVTDTESGTNLPTVKKKSIWKRIYIVLEDNRMRGKSNAEFMLAGSNPEDNKLLKKVLNIIFLTIGIALLVAVIAVIIYTTVDSS